MILAINPPFRVLLQPIRSGAASLAYSLESLGLSLDRTEADAAAETRK
jgi:hypothetical protein